MLKYRLEIKPCRKRGLCLALLYGLLLLSLFTWQPASFAYQLYLQLVLALLLIVMAFHAIANFRLNNCLFTAQVSEEGEWLYLAQGQQSSWQLSSRSRLSSQVLWLHLEPNVFGLKPRWLWIFKEQVNEQDYRRLCRCILFQHSHG